MPSEGDQNNTLPIESDSTRRFFFAFPSQIASSLIPHPESSSRPPLRDAVYRQNQPISAGFSFSSIKKFLQGASPRLGEAPRFRTRRHYL